MPDLIPAGRGLTLETIKPVRVAAYVEQDDRSPATISSTSRPSLGPTTGS